MRSRDDRIETALAWMAEGRKVALATVIATWGSSPRPVGSQLVVDAQGAFEGSVSGGCIEATIITEAQHSIAERRPQRLSLGVSDKQAWDTGLACGGHIEILVENAAPGRAVLERLMVLRKTDQNACLVTQLQTGAKQLIGAEESELRAELPPELRTAVARVHATGDSTLLTTDGQNFFLHGFAPAPQLIIIGAVHIAQPLASMARLTGYRVVIIDPRTAFATVERFPDTEVISRWPAKAFDAIRLHANTAVVALSHSPQLDDPALTRALQSPAFYIGALGGKKTQADRLERLKRAGFSDEQLQRIHGPVGLTIGSTTPAEIAVSIMAEITSVRRRVE
ncbi:MAG: XdhC family protein [Desulfobacterales bacterium]|nr:MAG: XdhC family protein [Desulfobacterales bacterium]